MKRSLPAILIGIALLPACGGEELTGPPEVKLGRHECAECGMLINEDRCSTALLVEDRGRRDYWHFDDIGCMLDIERKRAGEVRIIERFVRDYDTKDWLPAQQASFLMAHPKQLHTPMGTGIVAFATQAQATQAQAQFPGEVHDHASLVLARIAWLEKHFGPLDPPAGEPASPAGGGN